ncbi:biotin transporter BioY [bacterium]|nr:biotin transporter BioY [bacterium]
MSKVKVIKRQIEGIRLSLGSIFLVLFCTFLIILATFVQIDISHFIIQKGENLSVQDYVYTYKIIPQVPVVMFIGAFLGRKFGITSVLLYILSGLFVIPVFALGGGVGYVLQYGFGYILAYIPAVFFAGTILKSGFSLRNILQAVLTGVLTIHLIGTLYMLFLAGIHQEGWIFMKGWIYAQSGIKIFYDLVLSFGAVFLAKYVKIILWAFM